MRIGLCASRYGGGMRTLLVLLACSLLACSGPEPSEAPEPVTEAEPEATKERAADSSETLPPPFTGEQIRQAMPAGSTIRFRIESAGAPSEISLWEVDANPPEGLSMRSSTLTEDGAVIEGPVSAGPTPWDELRDHASFPATETTREATTVQTPSGPADGWRYVRTQEKEGRALVTTYEFASTLPGPPVLMTKQVEGKTVMSMRRIGE